MNIWHWLTAIHPSITDVEQRRQSRLLAMLAIALFVAGLVGTVSSISNVLRLGQPVVNLLAILPVLIIPAVAFFLNRQGRYLIAARFTVAALLIVILEAWLLSEAATLMYYFLSALFISAALLKSRASVLAAIVSISILIVYLLNVSSTVTIPAQAPLTFLLFNMPLLFMYIRHRDRLEQERQQELTLANDNLRKSEAELEERVIARIVDLQIAADVSKQITTILDLNRLLSAIVERTQGGFNLYHVSIFLYDETTQRVNLEASSGDIGRIMKTEGRSFYVPADQGLVPESIRTREAVVINDVTAEPLYAANPHLPRTRSEIALPMLIGETIIGVLDFQAEELNRFTDDDIRVMTTLAEQIAIAVNNVRLFQANQLARYRAEIINEINLQLSQAQDEQAILQAFDRFKPDSVGLLYYHTNDQGEPIATEVMASRIGGQPNPLSNLPQTYFLLAEFPAMQATWEAPNLPVFIEDINTTPIYSEVERQVLQRRNIQAMIVLPLKAGGSWQGIINLYWQQPRPFGEEIRDLLQILTPRLADHITARRAYIATQAARQENEKLYRMSQMINAATTYPEILTPLAREFGVLDFAVTLSIFDTYDMETAAHARIQAILPAHAQEALATDSLIPLWGNLADEDHMLIIPNMDVPEVNPKLARLMQQYSVKALMSAYLMLGERIIGLIAFSSDQPRRFSSREQRLIRSLGELAAAAVERSRLYREQVEITEQLREVDAIKSRFLASMSHELRTPLNAILNFTKFVSSGMLGEINQKQLDALNKVTGSSKHLLSLINDVLDITKIESGMLNLFIETDVNLQLELETVVSTAETLLSDKPTITLIKDIETDLPCIVADKRRIRQILLNLVSNACKFTEQGSVTISAKTQNGNIIMAVKDTGPGIDPDEQVELFEAFRQTKVGLSQGGGTGLGLAIAKRLAEAHEGRLWLDSAVGVGTNFYVEIPVASETLKAQIIIEGEPG